jgi:hypothetical protein
MSVREALRESLTGLIDYGQETWPFKYRKLSLAYLSWCHVRMASCAQPHAAAHSILWQIIYRLPVNLALIDSPEAFVILTNGYVLFNLVNHILTANKQLFFLEDKRAKAIRDN